MTHSFPTRSASALFNVGGQQHHGGRGDGLGTQRVASPHRTLGLHLQVITELLRSLLQRLGGHERVGDASRTRGDGDQARGALSRDRRRLLQHFGFDQHFGLFGATAQQRVNVLQGLGRGAAQQTFADETRKVQRAAGKQQNPLSRFEGRDRKSTRLNSSN